MDSLFPNKNGNRLALQASALLRRRSLNILDLLIDEKYKPEHESITDINLKLLVLNRPGSKVEQNYLKSFSEAVGTIAEKFGQDPYKMTVLDFYQRIETLIKRQPKHATGHH